MTRPQAISRSRRQELELIPGLHPQERTSGFHRPGSSSTPLPPELQLDDESNNMKLFPKACFICRLDSAANSFRHHSGQCDQHPSCHKTARYASDKWNFDHSGVRYRPSHPVISC
jgi:hypothetical protein